MTNVVAVQMEVTYAPTRGRVKEATAKHTVIISSGADRTAARAEAKQWVEEHYGERFRKAKVIATSSAELVHLVPFQHGFVFEGNEEKVNPPKRVVVPKSKAKKPLLNRAKPHKALREKGETQHRATVAMKPKQQVTPRTDAHHYKVTLTYYPGPTNSHLKNKSKTYARVPASSARHAIEQALRRTQTPMGYNGAPKSQVSRVD